MKIETYRKFDTLFGGSIVECSKKAGDVQRISYVRHCSTLTDRIELRHGHFTSSEFMVHVKEDRGTTYSGENVTLRRANLMAPLTAMS